jgi:fructosamine-3-kinase
MIEKEKLDRIVKERLGEEYSLQKQTEEEGGLAGKVEKITVTNQDKKDTKDIIIKRYGRENMDFPISREPNKEQYVLSLMENEIKIPQIILFDETKEILDRDYILMEKIRGKHLGELENPTEKELKNIYRELGRETAKIHKISSPTEEFGYIRNGRPESDGHLSIRSNKWIETYKQLFNSHLAKGKEREENPYSNEDIKRYKELFNKEIGNIGEVDPKLLHNDLWYTNIMIEDGKLTGIIDVERAMWGDKEYEVASMCEWMDELGPEMAYLKESFKEGYQTNIKLSENYERKEKLYQFERILGANVSSRKHNPKLDKIIEELKKYEDIS